MNLLTCVTNVLKGWVVLECLVFKVSNIVTCKYSVVQSIEFSLILKKGATTSSSQRKSGFNEWLGEYSGVVVHSKTIYLCSVSYMDVCE